MSCNRKLPHLWILPEDDAYSQIVNGFLLHPRLDLRKLQCLDLAKGWLKAVDKIPECDLRQFPQRYLLILIDGDQKIHRHQEIRDSLDAAIRSRVFVLGCLSQPEDLKRDCGHYESIGQRLAEACVEAAPSDNLWAHPQLKHNEAELQQMRTRLTFLWA